MSGQTLSAHPLLRAAASLCLLFASAAPALAEQVWVEECQTDAAGGPLTGYLVCRSPKGNCEPAHMFYTNPTSKGPRGLTICPGSPGYQQYAPRPGPYIEQNDQLCDESGNCLKSTRK